VAGLVIDACTVVTMDHHRTEHRHGHVVVDETRIVGVGAGPARAVEGPAS